MAPRWTPNYKSPYVGRDIAASVAASAQPQEINAGAWEADPANSQNATVAKPYGTGPGSTYAIYRTINFPQVSVGGAQYWYYNLAPPLTWASSQLQFKVHFIVEDAISLPGAYRFTLGVRRLNEPISPLGAKITGNVDYTLADSNIPRYRYTALSSAITVTSAVAGEALLLELTRGTAAANDESDPAYVTLVEIHYV